MPTGISYVDETWNPVCGCTKCSPGCLNCYAENLHNQRHKAYYKGKKLPEQYAKPFFEIQLFTERLKIPLHWRQPRQILCCSMGDLFHPDVPFEFILKIIGVTMATPWHTHLILTKRIDRILLFFEWWREQWRKNPILWGKDALALQAVENLPTNLKKANQYWVNNFDQSKRGKLDYPIPHPQPNVHFGVTICTQKEADEKIPMLLQIPAAHRWLSIEPMLEEINLTQRWLFSRTRPINRLAKNWFNWIVCGCESGPHRRPCKLKWIRSIVEQCKAAGVKCYVKQIDTRELKPMGVLNYKVSHNPVEWPKDLRVRETL